jgi:tetratricopeptide (TPR) repeat protein
MLEEVPEIVSGHLLVYAHEHHHDNGRLETERANLLGAATWARHTDRWALVVKYLNVLDRFLDMRGYYGERKELLSLGDEAAEKLDLPALRARICLALAVMASKRGAWNEALEYYSKSNQVVTTADEEGRPLFADVASNVGSIFLQTGRWEEAIEHYRRALDVFEQMSDQQRMADVLDNLGLANLYKGDLIEALATLERALSLRQRLKDEGTDTTLAATCSNLGSVYTRRGQLREAVESYQKALALSRMEEDPYSVARTLSSLALVYFKVGHIALALKTYALALTTMKRLDDVPSLALTYVNIGLIYEQTEDYDRAEDLYKRGLIIFEVGRPKRDGTGLWQPGQFECL